MNTTELEDFLILRTLDEPLPEDAFDTAVEAAGTVLRELTDEGVAIRWINSRVRIQCDGAVVGTVCHYQAENEETIREHAARAGLPVSRIDLHGKTLGPRSVSDPNSESNRTHGVTHRENSTQDERQLTLD